MSARWFRDNLMIVIAGVAFVAILSVSIVFLHQADVHALAVQDELATQQNELTNLTGQKVYPSGDNLSIVKHDREVVKKMYDDMLATAVRPPIPSGNVKRGIDFSQWMRSTVESLSKDTSNANVRVPPQFAFGFSRYIATFPCQNPTASEGDCDKILSILGKQLNLVKYLVKILCDSHVEDLVSIQRVDVEPGGSGADSLAGAGNNNAPNSLYATYPFQVQFVCDTNGLRNFLNNLAKADCLFVIRSINVDGTVGHVTVVTGEPIAKSDDPNAPKLPAPTQTFEVRRLMVTVRLDLAEFATSKPANVKR